MPFYDLKCSQCGRTQIDAFEAVNASRPSCHEAPGCPDDHCQGVMERVWLGKGSNVISDECDVVVKNGICNEDGTPRRYRFKSEMRAEAKRRGLVNHVEHLGSREGDKSKHTSRWI